jgi:hypothetical protein
MAGPVQGGTTVSLEWARFAWEVFVTLMAGLSACYAWWIGRDRDWKQQLVDLSREIEEHAENDRRTHDELWRIINAAERRVAILEEINRHAPNARDIHNLRDSISQLAQTVASQNGAFVALERTVERMNQFLMERGA